MTVGGVVGQGLVAQGGGGAVGVVGHRAHRRWTRAGGEAVGAVVAVGGGGPVVGSEERLVLRCVPVKAQVVPGSSV